ncbi:MAG: NAD(P) transhydrogenase subunit alpha [Bacillota bacterium]|jgi:NAD(P) transhydrogenase subunit alpha|nr:NAD(P) transhydrogenase subunit alpha [Bacillota bacterium]HOC05680.1 NAD(P) transhydrogenase subunit alpha [Bacillota bacterium]HPZ22474.1 NAD(P) transhydrogenase subunit alpha [Bacillota bacterium]HQD19237.1 NAD(P) transhydrogenase subunit alpha [Bacillota bacterium]
MILGVPREIMEGENRVAATPDTVKKYIADGFTVLVERGAGEGAYFLDNQYEEAGATIIEDPSELFEKADVILKVKEPLFNKAKNIHEVDMMHSGQYLITFLHPAAPVNHTMVKDLAAKGVISLTLDGIPRISKAQKMDALSSMSTCAGYRSVIMAAEYLSIFVPEIFSAVGRIKPAKALVIGTGVAGLQAVATARRLGAIVYASDIRPDACEQAKSLGAKVIESGVPADIAIGQGGYANKLPDEWLQTERENLRDTIVDMDIIILSALIPGKLAPILVTEDMVKAMRPGSVIIDISIDQGGNCELTEPGEVVQKHSVTISGIKNIPGHIATSSTWMFANNVYNLVDYLVKDGKMVIDTKDEITASILVTDGKQIVHEGAKEAMGL